jgi:hypothetical protein
LLHIGHRKEVDEQDYCEKMMSGEGEVETLTIERNEEKEEKEQVESLNRIPNPVLPH